MINHNRKEYEKDYIYIYIHTHTHMGFPGGVSGKEPACQGKGCKRHGFDPWVRKISWRRVWQPSPLFFKKSYLFICYFLSFLATPCCMWDLSSQTRDWTQWKHAVLTTGPPGKPHWTTWETPNSSILSWSSPMNKGVWRATVHRVETWLKWLSTHARTHTHTYLNHLLYTRN